MKRLTLTLAASAFLVSSAIAQEEPNPLALDEYLEQSGLVGLPTVSSVELLAADVAETLQDDDCQAAIPLLIEYADQTNHLANLIGRGLEPFYGSYGDERDSVSQATIRALIPAENKANDLRRERNAAWVNHAECLIKEGNLQLAAAQLHQALGLISPDETKLWERARNLLWSIVEFEPE